MNLVVEGKNAQEIAEALPEIARMLREGYNQGIGTPLNWDLLQDESFTSHLKAFNRSMDWIGIKTGPLAKKLTKEMEQAGGVKVKRGSIKIVCEFK